MGVSGFIWLYIRTVSRYIHHQTGCFRNSILGDCISGKFVRRNLKHKWGASRNDYSPPRYPRYCTGVIYALTRSAVSLLLNQTHNTSLIHLEDVSVGLLAQKAGNIKLIDIPKWRVDWNWISNILTDYGKYHAIHTGQGQIDKVKHLWKNIYT